MDYEDEDLKIKIFPKDNKKLLANATVSINTSTLGWVTVKGFQIWPSPNFNERLQQGINIKPPSNFVRGRYYDQVFFESKEAWYRLEELIYGAYLQVSAKQDSLNSPDEKKRVF